MSSTDGTRDDAAPPHHPVVVDYAGFARIAPGIRDGLIAASAAIDASGLEKSLTELIKLRASQINGCAFCIRLHLDLARRIGIEAEKLDLLTGWRDAGVFSRREAAALAWTEALTSPGDRAAAAAARAGLASQFDEREIVHLTAAIGLINGWNRIAIGLGFPPLAAR